MFLRRLLASLARAYDLYVIFCPKYKKLATLRAGFRRAEWAAALGPPQNGAPTKFDCHFFCVCI